MKRASYPFFLVMSCFIIFMAGCASPVDHKSPEELLSLSVAGLSGIDRYNFHGQTGISIGDRVEVKSASFQGIVENHNQIQVKSNEAGALNGIGDPLKLLKQIQATARKTELVKNESGEWTAVLAVTADDKAATEAWIHNLKGQFELIEKQVPAAAKAKSIGPDPTSGTKQIKLMKAWKEELQRSKAEFEQMLSTLHAKSVYKLIVDRKHLVPLKLEENSVLHYNTSDGEQHLESRMTKMSFQVGDKG
ncbi:hypothetical protein ACFPYJ_24105 [Paenibacillus solisilvae]|uniref:DUF3221 domain-containing protein n=1 Tax=Paenibacillus solisilvae TaxID=2486751 RepID=A0ABW0W3W4_9BACL